LKIFKFSATIEDARSPPKKKKKKKKTIEDAHGTLEGCQQSPDKETLVESPAGVFLF
jgi:hypothetical protein